MFPVARRSLMRVHFQQRNLEWFPRMRTSSLDNQEEKNKEDQDNRMLKTQMEDANKAIKALATELAELQKLVERFSAVGWLGIARLSF